MIAVNQIISWHDEFEGRVDRILWISEEQNALYAIDITKKKGLPVFYHVTDVSNAIETGKATWVDDDPWSLHFFEEELSPAQRDVRDKAWSIIVELTGMENEPAVFIKKQRGAMIRKVAEKHNLREYYIYRHLFRYWQRGLNKNALIPDYVFSGGKGKNREPGERKRGRPRKSMQFSEGINLTSQLREIICRSIKEFYLQSGKMSLPQAYQSMLKKYFSEDIEIDNGAVKVTLVEEEKRPSFTQFYQVYRKEFDESDAVKAREGEKEFLRNNRAITGDSTAEAFGPGEKFQFDATIADIYLVSRLKREHIIGRPVIYGVIDVFSRMVVGVYVGLEGPSWLGAMMALANVVQDKPKFCQEYGIAIEDEQWPCRHLPSALLADRGEMLQGDLEPLLDSLRIRGENTPAYRGDLKGIIERLFKTIQDEFRPTTPGAVQRDFQERGAQDYRLNAKLDIYQFTKIILAVIIEHNNMKVLPRYIRDQQMIAEDVKPIPIELWNWGVKNRSGSLRWIDEEIVKLNLMPRDNAIVTSRGILFKKMHYSCEIALKNRWFEKARQKGTWKIEVSYDPRIISPIYIRSENGREYEVCRLLDKDLRFQGMSLSEVEDLLSYENTMTSDLKKEGLYSGVQVRALIDQVVEEAITKTNNAAQNGLQTKKKRLKGIRSNRKEEREIIRQKEAFVLEDASRQSIAKIEVKAEPAKKEDGNVPSHLISYLLKQQKERGDS
ncbi:MAG: Mu transposase C-terminal domain-containing protein [Anaeromusa sp.]|uniref:Mu transposase C-terminal domain-containing protein n=1 Tax=Anaeromusa sp. TaxID=1872520 RepID=UPI002B21284A|nr:Mu transposase C-terminal domain-containing protein [Anaeromusa sp.]MEA4834727.1 Mu transposase C-terminal domain-containing protein [Anaeromusa sp.]